MARRSKGDGSDSDGDDAVSEDDAQAEPQQQRVGDDPHSKQRSNVGGIALTAEWQWPTMATRWHALLAAQSTHDGGIALTAECRATRGPGSASFPFARERVCIHVHLF